MAERCLSELPLGGFGGSVHPGRWAARSRNLLQRRGFGRRACVELAGLLIGTRCG
jgi:hypothetical protein